MTAYEYDIEVYTLYGWEVVDCQPTILTAKDSKALYEKEMPDRYRIHMVPVIMPTMLTDPEGR